MLLVSFFARSDCTAPPGELGVFGLFWSMTKIDFPYSHYHALAYRKSSLIIISGSGFHSRGVVCTSCMGQGVNGHILMP